MHMISMRIDKYFQKNVLTVEHMLNYNIVKQLNIYSIINHYTRRNTL